MRVFVIVINIEDEDGTEIKLYLSGERQVPVMHHALLTAGGGSFTDVVESARMWSTRSSAQEHLDAHSSGSLRRAVVEEVV